MALPSTMIEPEYIKKYILGDENINDDRIKWYILESQRQYMKGPLSMPLYIEITNAVIAGTFSNEQKVLLNEYIAPALARYTMMKLRPELTFQLTPKGSQVKNSEFSNAASMDDIESLMASDLLIANELVNEMREFLNCNSDSYPNYCCSTDAASGGIYYGRSAFYDPYINGRKYNGYGPWFRRYL